MDSRLATAISLALLGAVTSGCQATVEPESASEELPEISAKIDGAQLVPLELVLEMPAATSRRRRAIESWFFEAIAQSPYLDVDLSGPGRHRLILRGELPDGAKPSGALTTTYVGPGDSQIPLAGVELSNENDLLEAIDKLAVATRLALSESADSVRSQHRPAEAIVSPVQSVAEACSQARMLVRRKQRLNAKSVLERALKQDRTCALALSLLSADLMDLGFPREAVARARRVRQLPDRSSPTATHIADRILHMARQDYEMLLDLGTRAQQVRPRDHTALFSKALALCLLARYEEALPILEKLRARDPTQEGALFCLAHAYLGTGQAEKALALLPEIEERLPARHSGRLRVWILWALGRHEAIDEYLTRLGANPDFRGQPAAIELLGMQAAHALVTGNREKAGRLLLQQLDLLRSYPSVRAARGDLLVDCAWVLSRLGLAEECNRTLATMNAVGSVPGGAHAEAIVAWSISMIQSGKPVPAKAYVNLTNMGLDNWEKRLKAASLIQRGKTGQALAQLREAAKRGRTPTLAFEISECLMRLGKLDDAAKIRRALVEELSVPRMDQPGFHPLMRASLAFIYQTSPRH